MLSEYRSIRGRARDAQERFTELDPQAARVVELRISGGLTVTEAAEVVGISRRRVDNDWAMALMWLRRDLQRAAGTLDGE